VTDRLHQGSVPRVPATRRRLATAGAGLLLVALCGLCAAWGRAVLDTTAVWPAVLVTAAVLLSASWLFHRVREDVPGRLRLDGTVLVGRTLLGEHGVDLARLTAVSAGSDPEVGGIVTVRLTDDTGHLLVSWSRLQTVPEVRELLVDGHRRRALTLPEEVCSAWDVPPGPAVPLTAPPRRDGVERVLTALTGVGSVAAVAAGMLLA
jgi:hypothetical protein